MTLKLGMIFWMSDGNDGHFYIVITPPSHPEILLVNFSKNNRRTKDQACVVERGEHKCIVEQSIIAYDFAALHDTQTLEKMLSDGDIDLKPPNASNELILKIWDGAFATNRMKNREFQFLKSIVPT